MKKTRVSLPVVAVLFLVGFVYYTIVFHVTEQWLSLRSASGILNIVLFTVLTFMSLMSYTLAIVRDPGQVPATYMPDVEDSDASLHEVKRKYACQGGDVRYCQKCCHYKPPRAHHCRVCRRCVLRMDHHCVWINNCVGHENYKAFFLFVLYAVLASIYALVLLVGNTIHAFQDGDQHSGSLFKASYYHEGVRAKWLAEKAGQVYRHPYDLGVFPNLVSILGPSVSTWICPTATGHIGSGIRFRTFYDSLCSAQSGMD